MSAAATMKSTGISCTPDDPNDGERQPLLAQNTGEDNERLQIFLKGTREVAERNTGLLLIMASEAFAATMDAAAKILQEVEPPVSTFQVCLKFPEPMQRSDFATKAHYHWDDNYLH